jgi:hypothetical protein
MFIKKSINYLVISSILFVLSVIIQTSVIAEEQIKFIIDNDIVFVSPSNINEGILEDSHLTILGLTIGKHSITDVYEKLGFTEQLTRKEHDPTEICYAFEKTENTLIFQAGPMGGWKYLTGFKLLSKNVNYIHKSKCKVIVLQSSLIKTKSGIHLGMDMNQVKNIFGKPSKEVNNRIYFIFKFRRKMTDNEREIMAKQWPDAVKTDPFFDVSTYIKTCFINGKLEEIKITKIESY